MAIESKKWLRIQDWHYMYNVSGVIHCFDIPCFSVTGFIR